MASATMTYNDFSDNKKSFFDENKQDKLFSRVLSGLIALYLLFGIIVPFIERVEVPREIKEQVPVQLTRVMLKEKEIKEQPKPPEVQEKEPEPKLEELPTPVPKNKRQAAKEQAKSAGLAAMKDDLLSLREAFVIKPKSSELIQEKTAQAEPVKRKLLAAKANEKSQHIAAAQASTTVASDALSTHNTQTVRLAEEERLSDSNHGELLGEGSESLANVRSEVKLRQTLEANKARLYSIYNRALRKNPFLKGKVLFEIEIQPSGKVSKVTIQNSDLADQALERRLMSILRAINFGAEDVDVMTTVWAIEFLPR